MEPGKIPFKKDSYFNIFEKMNESVYVVEVLRDENDKIVDLLIKYANPPSQAYSNVLREELIGKKFSLVYSPEIAKSYIKIINEIIVTGEGSKYEIHDPKRDKYFLVSVFSFQDDLYMLINTDISEQKKTEEELKEKDTFLKSIFKTFPGVIWIYDLLEQENIYICHEMYELIGYTKEELQKKGLSFWESLYYPDDLEKVNEFLEKTKKAKNGEVIELEYRLRHKNGEWRWFNAQHALLKRTPEGKPWQFLGIVEDITHHKKTEELLRFSERTFRTLAENSPDIIIRFNSRLHITYVNPVLPHLIGKAREKFVGKSFLELEIPQKVVTSIEKLLMEVFETKLSKTLEFDIETIEGLKYYFARIIPEFERSSVETVLFVAHDISDIKQAEKHKSC